MMEISRKLVYKTLNFENPKRIPRQLWALPWAEIHYSRQLKNIMKNFPDDIVFSPEFLKVLPKTHGDPTEIGNYVDEWGCEFSNVQKGVIGEMKEPLIKGENWEDRGLLRIPEELLQINKDKINEFCMNSDKFVMAAAFSRPFERLQFIRGTEKLYIDLMLKPQGMFEVIKRLHEFYCELLTVWAETDVDALWFMDDWGSQQSLLINPQIWVETFKPMYKDYIDIAHSHNKKIFMHSDGHILSIIPHLIEIGLDAMNSQIFCMGLENLKKFKGQITFWGEIDRQQLLPHGSLLEIENAVKTVKENLWESGGCIAQCEFGPGGNPDNVYKVFDTWNRL